MGFTKIVINVTKLWKENNPRFKHGIAENRLSGVVVPEESFKNQTFPYDFVLNEIQKKLVQKFSNILFYILGFIYRHQLEKIYYADFHGSHLPKGFYVAGYVELGDRAFVETFLPER